MSSKIDESLAFAFGYEEVESIIYPNSVCYAINADWWLNFKDFVGAQKDTGDDLLESLGEIDNTNITKVYSAEDLTLSGLKPSLNYARDYFIISEAQWTYVHAKFKGGPTVPFFVQSANTNHGSSMLEMSVENTLRGKVCTELILMDFELKQKDEKSRHLLQVGRSLSLADLVLYAFKLFKVTMESTHFMVNGKVVNYEEKRREPLSKLEEKEKPVMKFRICEGDEAKEDSELQPLMIPALPSTITKVEPFHADDKMPFPQMLSGRRGGLMKNTNGIHSQPLNIIFPEGLAGGGALDDKTSSTRTTPTLSEIPLNKSHHDISTVENLSRNNSQEPQPQKKDKTEYLLLMKRAENAMNEEKKKYRLLPLKQVQANLMAIITDFDTWRSTTVKQFK